MSKKSTKLLNNCPLENLIKDSFQKLANTFKEIRTYKEFLRYMFAFLIYNDGIMMLMDFAAIIGGTLFGLGTVELLLFVNPYPHHPARWARCSLAASRTVTAVR